MGWSAVGTGIHDGDLTVVDRSHTTTNGDIVAAVIDGELCLKRHRVEVGWISLAFDNSEMPVSPSTK